jgi:mRNA-degrading endonuclease YafQ of YafQ-DinJ toxin-antitoxin module
MIRIEYSSYFVRKFNKMELTLQSDVIEKIEQFKEQKNHKRLEVHKLGGKMKGQWAFSINFSDRVAFYFSANKKVAYLLDVGDHSIYE